MNKSVILGLALIVLAAIGWFVFGTGPTHQAASDAARNAGQSAGAALDSAGQQAGQAADDLGRAASDTATAAGQAAGKAADAVREGASNAANAVQGAVNDVTEGATIGATQGSAPGNAAGVDPALAADPALTDAGFDPVKVKSMIDSASLDDASKTALKQVVDQAASNPALVGPTLTSVRSALGF
jgi:hypothetical protein